MAFESNDSQNKITAVISTFQSSWCDFLSHIAVTPLKQQMAVEALHVE